MMTIFFTILGTLTVQAAVLAFLFWPYRALEGDLIDDGDAELARQERIDLAVRQAFMDVGLNGDAYSDDFDLKRAGKLVEVLHIAGIRLGVDPELDTVGDVKHWLSE